jgi:hypothetical protein
MASKGRPPVAAAKQYAVGKLVELHEGEYKDLTDEYLTSQGWSKSEVTVSKWTQGEVA